MYIPSHHCCTYNKRCCRFNVCAKCSLFSLTNIRIQFHLMSWYAHTTPELLSLPTIFIIALSPFATATVNFLQEVFDMLMWVMSSRGICSL